MPGPTLLDCYHVRDLARFRSTLKGTLERGGGASSYSRSPGFGGHSWGSGGQGQHAGPAPPSEVNRRDHLGRTVLHLVCSSQEPSSIDYLHALLSHPSVNINLQDFESGWTPLHRALYLGNLLPALILLRRQDVDISIKDSDGFTAFDLYNSTVEGTNPAYDPVVGASELFTWGANSNYTLGLGDGDDRALPDRVTFRRPEGELPKSAGARFERIRVRDICMSKMHTVVMTAEKMSNVYVCGIGSNGRLGRSSQTQFNLEQLRDFPYTAQSIAVAQDHTVIVTTQGAVFTFGWNKFAQLGFTVEQGQGVVASSSGNANKGGGAAVATFGAPSNGSGNTQGELDIQITPRRLAGPLKKEVVLGASASKIHSAAFTEDALYTWGTNTGQLGYDRNANAVQVLPRKVTAISQPIKELAVTEFATACLLASWDVLVFHNDSHFRVNFPMQRFSSDMSVFRPRQAQPKPSISKLTSSGTTFAALSDMGDVFTFSLDHPSEYSVKDSGGAARSAVPKPQLVWSVRKKFTAVRDVAIGPDGSIVLSTESGHVYVRSRRAELSSAGGKGKAGGRAFKFQAVPYLQRIVKVCTNESGGFAAIKSDASFHELRPRGRTIEDDMKDLLPHLKTYSHASENEKDVAADVVEICDRGIEETLDDDSSDSDEAESANDRYVKMAELIGEAARRWERGDGGSPFYGPHNLSPPFGCDMFLVAGGRYLPAHRIIFAARVPALRTVLESPPTKVGGGAPNGIVVKQATDNIVTVTLPSCSFGTALFLLHYLYTDDLPAVWTASVGLRVERSYAAAKINRTQVQSQLVGLANLLGLTHLLPCLNSPVQRTPTPSLRANMQNLFKMHVEADKHDFRLHDVELLFSDRVVPAHSALLRRSPFFAALFQPHWTSNRWRDDGVIEIEMRHMRWAVARIVLLHTYADGGTELFDGTDAELGADAFIDFVVEVMAAANELLLDRLKLVCCMLLRRRVTPQNVSAIMTDAHFYHALSLKTACMDYSARTMETLLESGALEELEHAILRDFTRYVRERQDERLHRRVATDHVAALIVKHQDYYDDLDIPKPSLGLSALKLKPRIRSPQLAPADSRRSGRVLPSPANSPELRPLSVGADPGMMFSMDEDEVAPSPSLTALASAQANSSPGLSRMGDLSLEDSSSGQGRSAPWRAKTVEAEKAAGFDLRSIMAAEQARRSGPPSASGSGTATPVNRPMAAGPGPGNDVVPLTVSAKLSQRDRKRQMQQSLTSTPPVGPSEPARAVASSPWRLPEPVSPWKATPDAARPGLASPSHGPVEPALGSTPPRAAPSAPALRRTSTQTSSLSDATAPMTPTSSTGGPSAQPLGPTITPLRMQAKPPSQKRNVSGEAAWSQAVSYTPPSMTPSPSQRREAAAPALASSPPSTHTIDSGPLTFAQIQQQQRADLEAAALRANSAKKSLAEIIEEERKQAERAQEEKQREEEFLKWFEEESSRVRKDEARQPGPSNGGKGKGRKGAGTSGGGGGPSGRGGKRGGVGVGAGTAPDGPDTRAAPNNEKVDAGPAAAEGTDPTKAGSHPPLQTKKSDRGRGGRGGGGGGGGGGGRGGGTRGRGGGVDRGGPSRGSGGGGGGGGANGHGGGGRARGDPDGKKDTPVPHQQGVQVDASSR